MMGWALVDFKTLEQWKDLSMAIPNRIPELHVSLPTAGGTVDGSLKSGKLTS